MNNEYLYSQLVDALRLAASSYEIQTEVLPSFVHVPDEILLAFKIDHIPQLVRDGKLTRKQEIALQEYEKYLETVEVSEDYDVALEEVKNGEGFEDLRNRARELLNILGKNYEKPKLDGTVYVAAEKMHNNGFMGKFHGRLRRPQTSL